ncbi:MAG: hypothetical protein WBW08_05605 [Methyloceanibacter sp.]
MQPGNEIATLSTPRFWLAGGQASTFRPKRAMLMGALVSAYKVPFSA